MKLLELNHVGGKVYVRYDKIISLSESVQNGMAKTRITTVTNETYFVDEKLETIINKLKNFKNHLIKFDGKEG